MKSDSLGYSNRAGSTICITVSVLRYYNARGRIRDSLFFNELVKRILRIRKKEKEKFFLRREHRHSNLHTFVCVYIEKSVSRSHEASKVSFLLRSYSLFFYSLYKEIIITDRFTAQIHSSSHCDALVLRFGDNNWYTLRHSSSLCPSRICHLGHFITLQSLSFFFGLTSLVGIIERQNFSLFNVHKVRHLYHLIIINKIANLYGRRIRLHIV